MPILVALGSYPRFNKKGRVDSFTLDNCDRLILLGEVRNKLKNL